MSQAPNNDLACRMFAIEKAMQIGSTGGVTVAADQVISDAAKILAFVQPAAAPKSSIIAVSGRVGG